MSAQAWVDPANVSNISLEDFPPVEAGRAAIAFNVGNLVYVPSAPSGYQVVALPATQWDVYERVPDPIQPALNPAYYTRRTVSHEFRNSADTATGVVRDSDSRVFERATWDGIPAADLYVIRQQELITTSQAVEDQGRTVTGLSDGDKDLQTRDDMRLLYLSMVAQAALPGATAFKVADLWGVFFPFTIADAQIAVDQITTFHDAARLANADSLNQQLITHRDASTTPGDAAWQSLATLDLTTGWPPAPVAPKAAR